MAFEVSDKALERLEWPELLAQLARHARTPRGVRRCDRDAAPLFAEQAEDVAERLAATSEARAILESGELPSLGDVRDVDAWLGRLGKGGSLLGAELCDLSRTLHATSRTKSFLSRRAEEAPTLFEYAERLFDHEAVARAIDAAIEPDGQVKDDASPALAQARREAGRLSGEAQKRVERMMQDTQLRASLQDAYFTIRGDRYVLPVRAEAKSQVPGIVHDASSSGTTLFIEPQAVVDLNNRLKQAELTIERETRRVLSELSARAGVHAEEIRANADILEAIDLAFARGGLSLEQDAVAPTLDPQGRFRLDQLRHPLLDPAEAVPNDVRLGDGAQVLVVSGPNAGGKTVAMKSLALAVLGARAGLHVPAAPGAVIAVVDRVLADIGDEQDIRESLSTFSAHMANLAAITDVADAKSLVLLDEIGVGTDPSEGAALAQAVLEELADKGARVMTTTHYNLLKEMAEVDPRFVNASVEFDDQTLLPTYRLTLGVAGTSSATAVAARMGMPSSVLDRATALLDREDRKLDRMLQELQTSRAALERERSEAEALRVSGQAARDEYRAKLERLNERRDALFASMRSDLEQAFKQAHDEVADVIRTLQRGGRAQDAAQARERLLALEKAAKREEEARRADVPAAPRRAVDWQKARPGDAIGLPGGQTGTLVSLPDRRGRATVKAGSARLQIEADRLSPVAGGGAPEKPTRREHVQVEKADPSEAPARVDLRGLRVDEALDRLTEALDDAAGAGRAILAVIHGVGTGRLREAVGRFLRQSPYVRRAEGAPPEEGGAGCTLVHLS
ncbi:MAG: endonuclease MutS2 [Myxococcota bacterium]|nr:endonuclease MutS2 [Myxococcota bacterium]